MVQLTEEQKYEIIFKYKMGNSIKQISNDMSINKNTVNKWLIRYKNQGNIDRKEGSGRRKKINDEMGKLIIDNFRANDDMTLQKMCIIMNKKELSVLKCTIRNVLLENNFSYKNR